MEGACASLVHSYSACNSPAVTFCLKFTVGLFVAGGIAFVLLAIIWLGMSRFFEKGQYYVTYFNESRHENGICGNHK